MSKEGQFQVFYKNDQAYLTVYPAAENSLRVYPEDIIGRLKILGIQNVRRHKITQIIEKATGEPEAIAQWTEGKKLGPVISLELAEDNMTAKIAIKPGKQGGEPLSKGMILKFLKNNKVIHGIDNNIINSIVLKNVFNQKVAIAFGTPAINERPAEPMYLFVTDRGKPFKELEYERIDLKELNFIQNCKEGDILAQLAPPIKPVDGKNVLGELLLAERKTAEVKLDAGTGTKLSDDGEKVFAEIEGNVKLINRTVVVEPLVKVENVDYSNGNMDFNGAVDVTGRIADGFILKTKGDIQIGKSVSKVNIQSEGDIILKAGISGNDEGIIECGGNLYARYIESANITCKGNVFVEEAIMHSSIKCGGDIILKGKRAEIFGGRIFASGSIQCKKIGSINEPLTDIFLGLSLENYVKFENLQLLVSEHSKKLDEIEEQIRQIKNALNKNQETNPAQDKLNTALQQLLKESDIRTENLNSNLHKLHELKKNLKIDESSILYAEQQIYGKVHVYFNNIRWDSPAKGCGKTSLIIKKGKLLEK
ncbi:MAG: FapA family protein [Spirochaetales bacterium]|nr:FapA family protein [Spirochaetales bacterium]